MPLYEFEHSVTKERKELFYTMVSAPTIGSTVEVDGQQYVRVPSSGVGGIIDASQPKTLHALATKNTDEMIKRGDARVKKGSRKPKNPFWRPNKKLDTSLGNLSPAQKKKYILEGKR